jgi:hypothetical protein
MRSSASAGSSTSLASEWATATGLLYMVTATPARRIGVLQAANKCLVF